VINGLDVLTNNQVSLLWSIGPRILLTVGPQVNLLSSILTSYLLARFI